MSVPAIVISPKNKFFRRLTLHTLDALGAEVPYTNLSGPTPEVFLSLTKGEGAAAAHADLQCTVTYSGADGVWYASIPKSLMTASRLSTSIPSNAAFLIIKVPGGSLDWIAVVVSATKTLQSEGAAPVLVPLCDVHLSIYCTMINASGAEVPYDGVAGLPAIFFATAHAATATAPDTDLDCEVTYAGTPGWYVANIDADLITNTLMTTHFNSSEPVLHVDVPGENWGTLQASWETDREALAA